MAMAAENKNLHVALAFDHRFCIPAYATMRGICLSSFHPQVLTFHLCHSEFSQSNEADLALITSEFGAKIEHYNVAQHRDFQHLASTLPHTKHISKVMYARMLLDSIIAPDVHRIVYLDCDLLIRAPIEELLNSDLNQHPIGAVREPHALRFAHGRDAKLNHDLFNSADPFFNSGVIVMDLVKLRQSDIVGKLRALENGGVLKRLTNDQLILNYLFKNNWARLDGTWNMFAASRAIEGLDPKIVHYTGLNKPWNLISGLPFARVYRHVMTNAFYYRFMRERWGRYWKGLGRKLIGRGP